MIPCLVPEISQLDAFCDGRAAAVAVAAVAGIGNSRSWLQLKKKDILMLLCGKDFSRLDLYL